MAGDFQRFRTWLQEFVERESHIFLQTKTAMEHRQWQVEMPDGRFLDIDEALQTIPVEDLAMKGSYQYTDRFGYTIFLEAYRPNDPARPSAWEYSKYYYLRSRFYREDQERERQRAQEIVAAPGAYYIVTFAQNSMTQELYVQRVGLQSYTDQAQAEAIAKADEQKMYQVGRYGVVIIARKASSREDALKGIFLDD